MGGGNNERRKARKEQKKARIQASKDAAKMRKVLAQQSAVFEQQLDAQRQQMLDEAEKARRSIPTQTGATIGSLNQGVSPKSSKRKTVTNLGRGISSLRIPLNLRNGGGGINIG